ncbi:hypothetical protein CHK_2250 [Christensenella hongkongensis]|uniref:Uncharacterized protein n=1 Tax=Christensenella hongkongensis TaxID=270498 RepID=A0A0M2NIC6_9FIRM|nr:hypothetical protein CHK_2250 [Christensenella hongkongensis]
MHKTISSSTTKFYPDKIKTQNKFGDSRSQHRRTAFVLLATLFYGKQTI